MPSENGKCFFFSSCGILLKEVQPQETFGESFPCPVSSSHCCGLSSVAEGGTLHALWERENFVRKSSFGCVYMWRFPSLGSHLPLPRIFFSESHEGQAAFLPAGKQFTMLPLGMSVACSQLSGVCAEENLRWRKKGCGQSRKVYLSWLCMSVDVWFIVLDDDGAQDLVPVHKCSTPELRLSALL